MRLARIIVLLAGLAGCSAVKLGYNNLGQLASWWLDGYLDFSDGQAVRVREDLARLHQWHRAQELPRVIELLHTAEQLAGADITAAQACALVTRGRERLRAVAERAEPAAVTLALSLVPEQLQHLEHKYARNNADYQNEWVRLPRQEQREKRYRQFLERSETFYGTLDGTQRETLRRQFEQSVFDPQRILAERQRRQQDALSTLRQLAGQPVPFALARRLLRGYLERVQDAPDPAARAYQQSLIDEGCRQVALLQNSATAGQREAAVRRLRAYQRELRELATAE